MRHARARVGLGIHVHALRPYGYFTVCGINLGALETRRSKNAVNCKRCKRVLETKE